MKNFLFISLFIVTAFGAAQIPPDAITKPFEKEFPNLTISSWKDNSYYNYDEDWKNDIHYGDYDYDGYIDA